MSVESAQKTRKTQDKSKQSAAKGDKNIARNAAKVRCYETMFILKPTLVEEEIKARIEFFKDAISKNGGVIETCLDMGMRNLAYQIKKNYRGYYFVIYFKADARLIAELERLYGITEDVLRFIVIKYESKSEQSAWQSLVNRADKKEKPKTLKKDDGFRDRPPRHLREDSRYENRESFKDGEYGESHSQKDSKDFRESKSDEGKDSNE